jgi:hypothetical protein
MLKWWSTSDANAPEFDPYVTTIVQGRTISLSLAAQAASSLFQHSAAASLHLFAQLVLWPITWSGGKLGQDTLLFIAIR